MNYIIFEDNNTKLLSPFCDLHATFELRTGVFTNIDRLFLQISKDDTIQIYVRNEIKDIIRDRYPNIDVNPETYNPGIYLNGNSVWYDKDIQSIEQNLSYSNSSGLAAFMYDKSINYNEVEALIQDQLAVSSKLDVISIKYLWDIFDRLSAIISKDFLALSHCKKGALHPSCVLINDENIMIDDAKISAGTVLDASDGPIIIDKNAIIDIGVLIKGPVYIGKNSIINPGAKIRGPVSIGDHSKIGGEVEDSIVQGFSNKQHDGFLGHSYVGEWVNLGANTNTSDLKNNYSNIRIKLDSKNEIDTEKMFIGSIIGDFTSTAISTKLNSGTYIGTGSNIFDDIFKVKYIPAFSWGKDDKVGLNRFIKRCQIAMNRREKVLPDSLKDRLIDLWKRKTN